MRVGRGEAAIQAYVDSVIERDSYQPRDGEEQTPARDSKLKIAQQRMKLCYAKLNGSQLGEARRRLLTRLASLPCHPQEIANEHPTARDSKLKLAERERERLAIHRRINGWK